MSGELLQRASNAVRAETMVWLENFVEVNNGSLITPRHLDEIQEKMFNKIKEQFSERVGRKFIRTQIVDVILKEYGVWIFGVGTAAPKTEKYAAAIKKYSAKK